MIPSKANYAHRRVTATVHPQRVRHLQRVAVLVTVGGVVLASWVTVPAAGAHSFLVRTDPAHGARLAAAPASVALQFSEAVMESSAEVTLLRGDRTLVATPLPDAESADRVLRVATPELSDGIYLVAWHVTSAVDGHEEAGEFAFAVGDVGDAVFPSRRASNAGPGILQAAATWVYVIGVALATGAIVTRRALLPDGAGTLPFGQAVVVVGYLVALAGATTRWGLDVATRAVAGLGSGQATVAAGWFSAGTVAATSVAALMARLRPRRAQLASLAILAAGTLAWSARSHLASSDGWFGMLIDLTHLWAAALWLGALAWVAVGLWHARRVGSIEPSPWVRAYSRLALPLAAVAAAAGITAAVLLLRRPQALWTTGYGLLVSAKGLLVAGVLAVAWIARRALHSRSQSVLWKAATTELGLLVVVVGLSATLSSSAPPTAAESAELLLGPPPITGPSVRAAALVGQLTVGYQAGDGRLDIVILAPDGDPEPTLDADLRLPDHRTVVLNPRPCGAGCFTQQLALPDGTTRLSISAATAATAGGETDIEIRWPPAPEDPTLLTRTIAHMRQIGALEITETVTSGPDATNTATFTLTGAQFLATEIYTAGGATDIRPTTPEGTEFSFYIPGSQMWYTIHPDPQGRIATERIINQGHDIQRVFRYPDN